MEVPAEVIKIPNPDAVKKDTEIKTETKEKSVTSREFDIKELSDNKTKIIEDPKSSPVQKDEKTKSNTRKRVGLMFDKLIDSSFQKKT